jgi:hypothetical protein
VETVRRLMLTAVLSVVAVGSSAQAMFGIFIALVFMKVRLAYARMLVLRLYIVLPSFNFLSLVFPSVSTCCLLVVYLHSLSSSLWCLRRCMRTFRRIGIRRTTCCKSSHRPR